MSQGRSRIERAALVDEALDTSRLEGWLWDAACSIRGAVDAPKFKDYILPLIFVKRLSDVFDDEIERLAEKFGDRQTALELVQEDHSLVRFYIPREASWADIRTLTGNVGQQLTDVMRAVAKANPSLQGVIDIVDFNATVSGQRIVEDGRLSTLIEILNRHRLGLDDVEPDLFGRAYEYLLRKFAEGQGQSAGEFFTPKEVGWLIARLLRAEEGMEVYDPACGSAGLLIKTQLTVKESVKTVERPLRLYGQELNHVTYAIAKMNTIIHDMEGEIAIGDTLRTPKFLTGSKLKTFDLVAANPMWNQDGYDQAFYDADAYDRFSAGHPPASTADWGWVQHMLASLKPNGRAVVVLDTGAVSRGSGGEGSHKERDIRKELVDADLIEGVILLPVNLFYNTSSAGVLLCLNRHKPVNRQGRIILIDASSQFQKGTPKNFLSESAIDLVAEAFAGDKDMPELRTTITTEDSVNSDYNLSPRRFVARSRIDQSLAPQEALVIVKEQQKELEAGLTALHSGVGSLGEYSGDVVETPIGTLPADWKVAPLRDVAEMEKRSLDPAQFPDEVFEYYSIPAYQEGRRPIAAQGQEIKSLKLLVESGMVLFGKLNPRVPKIWLVGSPAKNRRIASTEFIPLVPIPEAVSSMFLYYLCWSEHVLGHAHQLTTGSTPSRQRVDHKALLDLLVPVPPLDVQEMTANLLAAVDRASLASTAQHASLEGLSGSLLGSLINGRYEFEDKALRPGG